jgi:membrane protease YdiL (CAAX protease family)
VAHLGYGPFPNWRFALVASVAGLCYGHAYSKTRSVRASMVAQALVNTVWRTCFS